MRIIYIFTRIRKDPYASDYPSRFFDSGRWYNGGYAAGLIIQFLAGAGAGYVIGSVIRGVIKAFAMAG